jgi:hypothetical protein
MPTTGIDEQDLLARNARGRGSEALLVTPTMAR